MRYKIPIRHKHVAAALEAQRKRTLNDADAPLRSLSCPLAQALNDAFPGTKWSVGPVSAFELDASLERTITMLTLGKAAKRRVTQFDANQKVKLGFVTLSSVPEQVQT